MIRLLPSVLLSLLCTLPQASADERLSDSTSIPQFLAFPYIYPSPELGWVFGAGANASFEPGISIVTATQYTSRDYIHAYIRGEVPTKRSLHVGLIRYDRRLREAYPHTGDAPSSIADADVDEIIVDISALYRVSSWVEIGPSALWRSRFLLDLTVTTQSPLPTIGLPQLDDGSVLMAGARARFHNTNPIRPLDGYLVNIAVRAGRSMGAWHPTPQPDVHLDGFLSYTLPFREQRHRLYSRLMGSWQWNTPPPVQNSLGGENLLRGLSRRRYFGRWLVASRFQYHLRVLSDWSLPFEIAHDVWDIVPVQSMQVEVVGFLDSGSTGDPSYGWRQPRTGFGTGLRFVLPPNVVATLDAAITPGGHLFFYAGVGETL